MRERPISFSGSMVRAILAGDKTQTRRIIKDPNGLYAHLGQQTVHPAVSEIVSCGDGMFRQTAPEHIKQMYISTFPCHSLRTPYGQPGERLWVREAFRFAASLDRLSPNDVGEKALDAGYRTPWAPTQFEADGHRAGAWHGFDTPPTLTTPGKLRPSIHMPRWVCRLMLEISSVRAERLNTISEADARAEGCDPWEDLTGVQDVTVGERLHGYKRAYQHLWEQLNGPGSWQTNPWVWVIEFRVLANTNDNDGGRNGHAA